MLGCRYNYEKVEQLSVNTEAVDMILTGVAQAIDNLSRPDFHLLKMAIGRMGAPQPGQPLLAAHYVQQLSLLFAVRSMYGVDIAVWH
jgi:uncharacterized protein (UPF0212 family)